MRSVLKPLASRALGRVRKLRRPPGERFQRRARSALSEGDHAEAIRLCEAGIEVDPLFNGLHMTMAEAMMPGDPYLQHLRRIHALLRPSSYLEVGVGTGASMACASANTVAIGIDPQPRIVETIIARARIYPTTSDDFFSRYDLVESFGGRRPGLAFIDGLHVFDQVLRDFTNTERHCRSDSVVLVHDCFPATAISAQPERRTAYWPGDVWKLIPCLKERRPDLAIRVVPCFPSGMAIITNLDPESRLLRDDLEDLTVEYSRLLFSEIPADRSEFFSVLPNHWESVAAHLLDHGSVAPA